MTPSLRACAASLLPITLSLCAAAPPDEGASIGGATGADYYEVYTGGCTTARATHRAVTGRAHVHGAYRARSGLTVAAEASGAIGRSMKPRRAAAAALSTDVAASGALVYSATLGLRGGWHGDYAGVEAGALPILTNTLPEGRRFRLSPSARAWAGVPNKLYVWGSIGSGPTLAGQPGLGLGIGHAAEALRMEAGYLSGAAAVHVQARQSERLWIGAQLQVLPAQIRAPGMEAYGALVTFSAPLSP